MLKKTVAFLLSLLLLFSFSGCKNDEPEIFESEEIENIALYVNNSYVGDKYMIYCLYTVKAVNSDVNFFYFTQNGSSIGSGATLTIDSVNVYDDLYNANPTANAPFEITTLTNPALGQTVKKGESLDFVSVFLVNKSDLSLNGKAILTITAADKYLQKEEIAISKITYIESGEALARKIAPDGKTQEELLKEQEIEQISGTLLSETDKALEGTWAYEYENEKTELTFKNGSFTETKTKTGEEKPYKTNKGTYSIRKKVILVTLKNGEELRIPYTFQGEKLSISFEF